MSDTGLLVVVCAPSGGGKSTIIKRLMAQNPEWTFSVSATTRPPREGEKDGREYYFLSREEFLRRVETGEFLEYEEVHGDLYGTLRAPTEERVAHGETVIFDLDVKGALSVKKSFPEALTIFLLPPSMEVLRERLMNRRTEPLATVERRLTRCGMEMKLADRFDARVVNDKLEQAVAETGRIIEEYRS